MTECLLHSLDLIIVTHGNRRGNRGHDRSRKDFSFRFIKNYIYFYRYLSRPFVTALTCSLFILPLCFFKRLDVLSYASSLGCVTIVYVVCLIIYESYLIKPDGTVPPMKIWPDSGYEALQIVPIICFAYQVFEF